jgi:hypothetical protein
MISIMKQSYLIEISLAMLLFDYAFGLNVSNHQESDAEESQRK